MSKYKLEFRHRPDASQSIEEKHKIFLENISLLDSPWNLQDIGSLDDIGSELILIKVLDEVLLKGIKGRIQYCFRNEKYLTDIANRDDVIIIEYDGEKVKFDKDLEEMFVKYIGSFDCYKATVHEVAITRKDWPNIVREHKKTHKDINGRDGVYRINSVNYFDEELCKRAFKLSPKAIVKRLTGKVESVSLLNGGVYLVYSSKLLTMEELENIDCKVRSWLKKVGFFSIRS